MSPAWQLFVVIVAPRALEHPPTAAALRARLHRALALVGSGAVATPVAVLVAEQGVGGDAVGLVAVLVALVGAGALLAGVAGVGAWIVIRRVLEANAWRETPARARYQYRQGVIVELGRDPDRRMVRAITLSSRNQRALLQPAGTPVWSAGADGRRAVVAPVDGRVLLYAQPVPSGSRREQRLRRILPD